MRDYLRCDAILALMNRIVDREASLGQRIGFYFHLSMCKHCRRYFRQFQEMRLLTKALKPQDLPDEFFAAMEECLPRTTPAAHTAEKGIR